MRHLIHVWGKWDAKRNYFIPTADLGHHPFGLYRSLRGGHWILDNAIDGTQSRLMLN